MQIIFRLKFLFLAFCLFVLAGCPTIAPYNQRSYELTTSTKAEALAVLDKATDSYGNHVKEVEKLRLEVEKAYEYANGIPQNEIVVGMWNVIRGYKYSVDKKQWVTDDNGSLYSTLELWRRNKILSPNAVIEKKQQVASSFDQIIGLEGGKNKK